MRTEKINILLVDDKAENLLALENILREVFDLHYFKALSGYDALKLASMHELALILLDVQMPEMDGFETAQMLHAVEKTRTIPIIFVTAIDNDPKYAFKGYGSGAVDFLFKPINSVILNCKVSVFLELYRKRQELEESLAIQNQLNDNLIDTINKLNAAKLQVEDAYQQIQSDLDLAREFQQTILPNIEDPHFLKVAVRYYPFHGHVSGDIYDMSMTREGDFNNFLGDAMGHGVAAAFMTMITQMVLDNIPPHLPTNEILSQLNTLLNSRETGLHMTGVFLRITSEGHLAISHAGHPPSLLIPANGQAVFFEKAGVPLGIFFHEPTPYVAEHHRLQNGDRLFVYTDGVTEIKNLDKKLFGIERLSTFLSQNKHQDINMQLNLLLDHLKAYSQRKDFGDDLTIIGFEFLGHDQI